MAEPTKGRRRSGGKPGIFPRRRLIVLGVALVLVLGGFGVAWATTKSSSGGYRTTAAGPAQVTATLANTGTVEPVSEATISFPLSGQVASVAAQQGQQVDIGQDLADLNTTSIASQVSSAQSTVATAQAKLASDQASETTAVTSSSDSSSGGSSSSSHSSSSSSGSHSSAGSNSALAGLAQGLTSGQAAVKNAQGAVDGDLTLVSAAVKQENSTCPAVIQAINSAGSGTTSNTSSDAHKSSSSHSTSSSSTSSSDTSSSDTSPSDSTSPTTTPPTSTAPPVDVSGCTTLLNQVLTDQNRTSTDEQSLASAEAALTTALNKADQAVQQAAQSTGSSSGSHTSTTPQAATPTGGSGHTSAPASPDQLAADQASIDAANAQLAEVQQNLAAASLVSPIAGTVAQVTITAGQSVSANSTSATIVIIGPGTSEVTTAVTDNQVGQVKPGEAASIVPDGGSTPIPGTVTAIGALGTTTSSGSASYPVTISLKSTTQPLYAGSNAAVSITLGSAKAAVTVPTSAVHTIGSISFVTEMRNGKATTVPVKLGVIGSTVTQITSGVSAGDQVVLADLGTALPTAGTTGARGFGGGGGGFGGGAAGGRAAGGGGAAGGGAAGGGGRGGG
jgi:HlyD family secretion protein